MSTGNIRVNGGILDDQMLTGSLRYFSVTNMDFSGAFSDGTVEIPLNARTSEKLAEGTAVPNSAAEQVTVLILTKSTVVQVDLTDTGMVYVLENTTMGWDKRDPQGKFIKTAAECIEEAIRAMGVLNTPTGEVDATEALVEEFKLVDIPVLAEETVNSVFGRTGDILPLREDYSDYYANYEHTHTESDIIDLDKYTKAEVDSAISGSIGDAVLKTEVNGAIIGTAGTTAERPDLLELHDNQAFIRGNTETNRFEGVIRGNVAWDNFVMQHEEHVLIGKDTGLGDDAFDIVAIGTNAGFEGKVPSGLPPSQNNVAIGTDAGKNSYTYNDVYIGHKAGESTAFFGVERNSRIGIGFSAGHSNQGDKSIAIGNLAGQIDQPANSLAIGNGTAPSSDGAVHIATVNASIEYIPVLKAWNFTNITGDAKLTVNGGEILPNSDTEALEKRIRTLEKAIINLNKLLKK